MTSSDTAPHPLVRHTYWAVSHAVEDLVLIHENTDSVRAAWYEATCIEGDCDWHTTGSEPNVEDAAHEHVAEEHPEVVQREKLILAAARAYCETKFAYTPKQYATADARERHIAGDTASHARVESFRAAVNAALDAAQEVNP
jgi:hypothetical protein